MEEAPRASVLFVCMGNICRSPTAEAVFREHVARAGLGGRLLIESAGTGDGHVGEPPDHRAIVHARRRGYDLAALRARQVQRQDFTRFAWILAMDMRNLRDLVAMRPSGYPGHLGLLLDFVPDAGTREVPDPYFGGPEGFENVLDLMERASVALLARIRATESAT
jgi:protein-tyrosine phosphatase